MPRAVDANADPNIFELDLEARVENLNLVEGGTTPVWTYNGGLPGPFIRAKVGDRLIAHFRNRLSEPTTVHWHGIRLPVAMDGAPGHSQPEVKTDETFTYDFVLPDPGLYWYHPHVDSAVQVGFGLYGALLVEDPNEPKDLGDELVLVLSDMGIREDGSLEDPTSGGNFGTLFGREGNTLLVNGRVRPLLKARGGRRQRWHLVNAAKSRYFQLAMADHTFTRIGGDTGMLEKPVESPMFVIAPGERADVLVTPHGFPGQTMVVRWVPFDRGFGTTFNRPEDIAFLVEIADDGSTPTAPLPDTSHEIETLDITNATQIKLDLTQTEVAGKIVMGINGIAAENAVPVPATVGQTQVFILNNTMDFSHPFHLHGFFFQPLDEALQPIHPMEWKDTLDVPVKGMARFAVRYENRPGMWMFHCHILDHSDAGMMGMVSLTP